MIRNTIAIALFVGSLTLAACGGGGSGGGYGGPAPVTPATNSPGSGTQSSNIPQQQTVTGTAAFVNPANNRTLYFLDVDTATGGTCTGGCLSIWPVLAPSSGATPQGNFTMITRSDGTGMQWAYQGHPLYMYAGDSGPDQANGDGIAASGGHWHVARPTATSAPTGSPPCTGPYC